MASRIGSNVCRPGLLRLGLQRHGNASVPSRLGAFVAPFNNKAQKVSHDDQIAIIEKQRRNRPVAPHLGVYNLKQTWLGSSAWMRLTGLTVGGAVYSYFAVYAVSPLFGWHVESQSLVESFATLAPSTKGIIKFGLAFPFSFHFFNGIKQLIYDMGYGFTRRNIDRGQAVVWVAGTLSGLFLAFGI